MDLMYQSETEAVSEKAMETVRLCRMLKELNEASDTIRYNAELAESCPEVLTRLKAAKDAVTAELKRV